MTKPARIAKTLSLVAVLAGCSALVISALAFREAGSHPNVRVQFVNSQVGWIVGPRLLQTADGGRTWKAIRNEGVGIVQAESVGFGHRVIQFVDDNVGFQLEVDTLARTSDGGRTWPERFHLPKSGNKDAILRSLFFLSAEVGWIVSDSVYRTNDGGRSWTQLSLTPKGNARRQGEMRVSPTYANYIPALWFTDSENGLMARMDGEVYRTEDGGRSWRLVWSADKQLTDVFFIDNLNGWIVGDGGLIVRTADGGRTWTPASAPVNVGLTSVFFFNKQSGCAAGDDSTILYTRDGGMTWKVAAVAGLLGSPPLGSISFADEKHGWAVGGDSEPTYPSIFAPSNVVLATDDGGQSWRAVRL